MIKLTAKREGNAVRVKVKARERISKEILVCEAISAISSICGIVQKEDPDLTPAMILEVARKYMENQKPSEGLTVRCYKPADECEHYEECGWCGRFDRPCAEVHNAQAMEDGDE